MALAQAAPGGFPDDGERFGQQVVEGLPARETLPELAGLGLQPGVGKGPDFWLQRVDFVAGRADFLDRLFVGLGYHPYQCGYHATTTLPAISQPIAWE